MSKIVQQIDCIPLNRSKSPFELSFLDLSLDEIYPMRLTIATEEGTTFNIEVDASMELENVMALLEAEVSLFSLL